MEKKNQQKGFQIKTDFNLVDQFGDSVRLYDFCHKAVLLKSSAFW